MSGLLGWGGGIAPTAFPLSRYFRESVVKGLDSSEEIVALNRRCCDETKARNLSFELFDLANRYEGHPFDVVVFADIARSYSLDSALVRSAASLVAPGGLFVMVVPSRDQIERHYSAGRTIDAGFSNSEIRMAIEEAGLELSRTRTIIGPLAGYLDFALRHLSTISFHLVVFLFPFLLALSSFDLFVSPGRGNALLVTATRPRN